MSFLYVTNPIAKISVKDHQIIMEEDNCLTKVPIETLEGIVAIGNMNMTVGCSKELLKRGIPTTFLATNGQYFGRLESTRHHNILRQRLQFRAGENTGFKLALSKKIVEGKARNQLVILRRRNRYMNNEQLKKQINAISVLLPKLSTSNTIPQLMGYEGSIAKAYFSALGKSLPLYSNLHTETSDLQRTPLIPC